MESKFNIFIDNDCFKDLEKQSERHDITISEQIVQVILEELIDDDKESEENYESLDQPYQPYQILFHIEPSIDTKYRLYINWDPCYEFLHIDFYAVENFDSNAHVEKDIEFIESLEHEILLYNNSKLIELFKEQTPVGLEVYSLLLDHGIKDPDINIMGKLSFSQTERLQIEKQIGIQHFASFMKKFEGDYFVYINKIKDRFEKVKNL